MSEKKLLSLSYSYDLVLAKEDEKINWKTYVCHALVAYTKNEFSFQQHWYKYLVLILIFSLEVNAKEWELRWMWES